MDWIFQDFQNVVEFPNFLKFQWSEIAIKIVKIPKISHYEVFLSGTDGWNVQLSLRKANIRIIYLRIIYLYELMTRMAFNKTFYIVVGHVTTVTYLCKFYNKGRLLNSCWVIIINSLCRSIIASTFTFIVENKILEMHYKVV